MKKNLMIAFSLTTALAGCGDIAKAEFGRGQGPGMVINPGPGFPGYGGGGGFGGGRGPGGRPMPGGPGRPGHGGGQQSQERAISELTSIAGTLARVADLNARPIRDQFELRQASQQLNRVLSRLRADYSVINDLQNAANILQNVRLLGAQQARQALDSLALGTAKLIVADAGFRRGGGRGGRQVSNDIAQLVNLGHLVADGLAFNALSQIGNFIASEARMELHPQQARRVQMLVQQLQQTLRQRGGHQGGIIEKVNIAHEILDEISNHCL